LNRILLMLEHQENQALLAAELERDNEVVAGTGEDDLAQDFDLCILDGASLDRLQDHVRARKDEEQPVLLPILLVTSRPGVRMITRHLWRIVDELIVAPIEKPELRARVEILLRARSLSVALRQRADEAEQATRMRDELLAMVSHDLRNPLNLVLTNGWLLLESGAELDERARGQVEMIRRAADHMHRLIQDLLDVSGIEAGSFAVELRRETAHTLVNEACHLLEHEAVGKGISLLVQVAPDLPPVCADRGRILQLFGNLIGNAIKFTPQGGTIRIGAEQADDAVRFSVTDDGPGISAEDLPRVFDRFWRGGGGMRARGAGLGLAIARGIVQSHGGTISADSEVGHGSTFSFTLPRADLPAPQS
jgi:signal transduction histidine kinase